MRQKESELLLEIVPKIGAYVEQGNLLRLIEGDLVHIGIAISQGHKLKVNGKPVDTYSLEFNLPKECYTLNEPKRKKAQFKNRN